MGAVRKAGRELDPTQVGLLPELGAGEFIEENLLGGAEREAAREQARAAQEAQDLASGRFEQIVTPGLEIGQQAQQQQAALSGALGPEAQAAAFQGFQESPGTAFLREQGLREVGTQAAVTGQGGGNRLRALTEFSQGLALQDLSRQQGQLSSLAGQGIALSGVGATLTGLETGGISAEGAALAQKEVAGAQAISGLIEQGTSAAVGLS